MSDLNLHVHDAKRLGADVNLDQSRIHRLIELSETLDESDRSLFNVSEWVGEGATRDGTAEADAGSQTLHHRTVEAMCNLPRAEILSVRGLHLAPLEGLDANNVTGWVGLLHCRRGSWLLGGDYAKTYVRI